MVLYGVFSQEYLWRLMTRFWLNVLAVFVFFLYIPALSQHFIVSCCVYI